MPEREILRSEDLCDPNCEFRRETRGGKYLNCFIFDRVVDASRQAGGSYDAAAREFDAMQRLDPQTKRVRCRTESTKPRSNKRIAFVI